MGKSHSAPSLGPKDELQGTVVEKVGRSITKTSPEMDHFCTLPSG